MNKLRALLSPGWILGVLAVVAFTWLCFSILAPWQLGKNTDLDERNDRLAESVVADPEPIGQVMTSPDDWVEHEWRLVTLSGEFDPDRVAMLRLRSVEGEPVYNVLGVFRSSAGEEYLVNRGWIHVGEGHEVPPHEAAPSGEVDIIARARNVETADDEPIDIEGHTMVRAINPEVLADEFGDHLVSDGYLQLAEGQPGVLGPPEVPGIESGPYLSYGIQWLAFGIFAPVALGYFAWSRIRTVRDDEDGPGDDDAGPAPGGGSGGGGSGGSGDGSGDAGGGTSGAASESATFRSRYGDRYEAERRRARKRRDRFAEL